MTDVVPDCVPGQYILAAVSASIAGKGYRLYSNGYGFHSELTVDFENQSKELENLVNHKPEGEVGTSTLPPPTVTPFLFDPKPPDPSLFPSVMDILRLSALISNLVCIALCTSNLFTWRL